MHFVEKGRKEERWARTPEHSESGHIAQELRTPKTAHKNGILFDAICCFNSECNGFLSWTLENHKQTTAIRCILGPPEERESPSEIGDWS